MFGTITRLATPGRLCGVGAAVVVGAMVGGDVGDVRTWSAQRLLCEEKLDTGARPTSGVPAWVGEHAQECGQWRSNWDGRADTGGAKRVLVFVRHGQYVQADTDEGRVLTELGRQQAKETGQRLKQLVDAEIIPPIDCVYFSTMARATETAAALLESLDDTTKREPCALIREGAVCRPIPESQSWQPTPDEFRTDNAQVEAAVATHMYRSQSPDARTTVFSCHGNVIRYMVMRLLQLPVCAWLRTAVYNGSITIVEIRPNGNVSLRCMGDVGHMDPKDITYN